MSTVLTIDDASLREAREIVNRGGVIVVPTDTVYGIACDPFNEDAVDRIYEVKRRPRSKALQILVPSVESLESLGLVLPAALESLSAALLPGPFSPIAVAEEGCSLATVRREPDGSSSQAIRVPDSDVSRSVLMKTGALAASSANRSGGRSPQSVEEAVDALGDDVDLYLDGGPTSSHVASTVVAADSGSSSGVSIIREGVIPAAEILRILHADGGGLVA